MKRLFAAAAVLALFSQAAAAGELILFADSDFRGARVSVQRDMPDLNRAGFNDRASSLVVRSGYWELCEHTNFGGRCDEFGPGEYRGLPRNDSVSSVREITRGGRGGDWRGDRDGRGDGRGDWRGDRDGRGPRGDDVQIFSAPRFEGAQLGVSRDMNTLTNIGFNDRAASIIIREGRWEFCEHADFRGQCVVYGPGRYSFLERMNNRISSLRRVR